MKINEVIDLTESASIGVLLKINTFAEGEEDEDEEYDEPEVNENYTMFIGCASNEEAQRLNTFLRAVTEHTKDSIAGAAAELHIPTVDHGRGPMFDADSTIKNINVATSSNPDLTFDSWAEAYEKLKLAEYAYDADELQFPG